MALDHVVVKEAGRGTSEAPFDFIVYGIRAGFEGHEPIQPNTFGIS